MILTEGVGAYRRVSVLTGGYVLIGGFGGVNAEFGVYGRYLC